MIAFWIIAGIVWLIIGYLSISKFSKDDDIAPPLFILICCILCGPVLPVVIVLMEALVEFLEWAGTKTNFSMEKYIRKFLRMKEK